ncbi:MAG: YciI-like protein [Hyphomonadaceae bacterium]
MKHFLLFYDYAPDYMERRGPHRGAHFAHAAPALERGEMFLAGACTDEGPPIGVLVFKCEDRATVEAFAKADPYVLNGVATGWRVREWTTVAGRDALTKV